MPENEYRVTLKADTKDATDKLDAVSNTLKGLTETKTARITVDANAVKQAVSDTKDVARNLRSAKIDASSASGFNLVSRDSLNSAFTLASTFYGLRKDVKGLGEDAAKALTKTNFGEFLRTDKYLDKVLQSARGRTAEIVETYKNIREIPGVADVALPLENFARVKAFETFGSDLTGSIVNGAKEGVQKSVQATKNFLYANLFNEVSQGASRTIDTLARLGLAIQGVQILVGPLAAAWSSAFDAIVGQNIRLEQTILSTQTTLASTARVINSSTGVEVTDPLEKIQALEGGVRQAIDNIRVRSLDLAGVTSSEIIDIFSVVATSISQIGGNIKDAEDLAISFTSALGTLGIPFYQARQEIGSILGGYITEDSLLAKRLQISNKDIEKAKSSVDGVVGYLQKKLETAVAGQAIQSKGFSGVTSNIKEVVEVIAQQLGKPLLAPIVAGLTSVYDFLKSIQGIVAEVGGYLSTVLTSTIGSIVNVISQSKLAKSGAAFIDALAAPYKQLARAVELGLGEGSTNLLQRWLNGLEDVPPVMQGIVTALQSFGTFLKLQIELVTQPILDLLDQTRERIGGFPGLIQAVARAPQAGLGEFGDAFTKGWDTLASTVELAAKSIGKFVLAIAQLKLIEITASVRAAADVFELFGSLLLGKINLALSFFDNLGNLAGTDLAKFSVSLYSISKLLNDTEAFGLKGLIIWGVRTRAVFKQVLGDVKLFVSGYRDAGNITNLVNSSQESFNKLLNQQSKSGDAVVKTAADIEKLKRSISSLQSLQAQAAANNAGAAALQNYSKAISKATADLAELEKSQAKFTFAQRTGSILKTALGGGGAETAALKEAARQATITASGAASAQVVGQALETLRVKLKLSDAEFKSFGGAVQVATKSLQTFATTTALIELAFGIAVLAIAAGITAWQQYEEAQKKASIATKNAVAVQKILASGFSSVIAAAEGGDVAAKRFIENQRDIANAQYQSATSDLQKLVDKYSELNDKLFQAKEAAKQAQDAVDSGASNRDPGEESAFTTLVNRLKDVKDLNEEITRNKAEQAKLEKRRFEAQEAILKLERETKLEADFKLLGERRLDLEEKIKVAREDFVKEVTEKEFQTRLDLLNIEQQKRNVINEKEKAALTSRLQLLINNSNDQEAKILQLVSDYNVALLEGVNQEDQRRSELIQKQLQLQKDIDDYGFKIARERIALERQVGNYKKQIEQYLNDQQVIRLQKEVIAAKQRGALLGEAFQPYSLQQQQEFINATQKPGQRVDSRAAYALLQVIPKSVLGLSGDESGEVVIEKLKAVLGRIPISYETLVQRLKLYSAEGVDVTALADALYKDAGRALNLNKYLAPPNRGSVTVPDLNIDFDALEARIAEAGGKVLAANTDLLNARAAADKQRIALILEKAADPSTFTDVKLDYTGALDKNTAALNSFVLTIKAANKGQFSVEAAIEQINQQFITEVRTIVADYNKYAAPGKQLDADGLAKFLIRGVPLTGTATEVDLLNARNRARTEAINRVRAQGPAKLATESGDKLLSALKSNFEPNKLLEQRANALNSTFDKLNEINSSIVGERYSLKNTISGIDADLNKFKVNVISSSPIPLTSAQLKTLNEVLQSARESLVTTATILDPVNKALDNYKTRVALATELSGAYNTATRTLIDTLLSGSQDLRTALSEFNRSVGGAISKTILDNILAPFNQKVVDTFNKLLGVSSAKQQAELALKTAADKFNASTTSFATAVNNFGTIVADAKNPATPTPTQPDDGGENKPPGGDESASSPITTQPFDPDLATLEQTFNVKGTKAVTESLAKSFEGFGSSLTKLGETAKATAEKGEEAGEKSSKGFEKFLGSLVNVAAGVASVAAGLSAFDNPESTTADKIAGVFSIAAGILSTASSIKFRAAGGPVSAGRPYVVGEVGPELILPTQNGTVLTADQTQAVLGGGNAGVNSVVNITISDSGTKLDETQASMLGRMVDAAVLGVINREKRAGGVLNRR